MTTSKIQVSEGSGKNIATASVTEDTVTKELQRIIVSKSDGNELDVATQTTLAAILTKIISNPATETTIASILSKLNASIAVTGTFFQATQPISGTITVANPTANPETGLAKDAKLDTIISNQTNGSEVVSIRQADLAVTATGAAAAAVTATLPAVAGKFHNIIFIEITAYSTVARTGGVTPVLVTTTNLPSNPAFTFGSAAAVGTTDRMIIQIPIPLKSSVVNTITSVVCPATASIIWRVNIIYNTSA